MRLTFIWQISCLVSFAVVRALVEHSKKPDFPDLQRSGFRCQWTSCPLQNFRYVKPVRRFGFALIDVHRREA
jgi:hypothetical protein